MLNFIEPFGGKNPPKAFDYSDYFLKILHNKG